MSKMGDAIWAAYERQTGKRPMDPSLLTGKNDFERGDWSGPDWGKTSLKTLTGSFAQQRNARLDKMNLTYRQRYGSIGWRSYAPDNGYGMTGNEPQHYRPALPSAGTPSTPAAPSTPSKPAPPAAPPPSGGPGPVKTLPPPSSPASRASGGRMGLGTNPAGRVASFRSGNGTRPQMQIRSF